MATLGNANTPGSGYWFDTTTNKQFWNSATYTMPSPGGYATQISVYCGGYGGNVTGQLVIWNNGGGGILWQSGNITLPSSAVRIGGQGWVRASIPNFYLASGTQIKIGFWSSGQVIWTFDSSGGVYYRLGVSSPQSESGTNDEYAGNPYGYLGAYIDYTPLITPVVTSATPNYGAVGDTIVVAGSGFVGISSVTVCGVAASYTVNSSTQITLTVPSGAVGAGTIAVTNAAGTGSVSFTVSGGYVFRSGLWGASPVYVFRSGAWQVAQGVFVYRSGTWQPAQ